MSQRTTRSNGKRAQPRRAATKTKTKPTASRVTRPGKVWATAQPPRPAQPHRIRVGTASWADPGFIEEWYPADLPARKRLAWYAEHFDLVEVNSTFYAVPAEKAVAGWVEQTPKDFLFDVKLHRLLSRHSTPVHLLPSGLRRLARTEKNRVVLTPRLEKAVLRAFLENIEPLREAGKLGALLLQLSPSFSPRRHKLAELDSLVGYLKGYDLAVELRNRHWLDEEHRDKTLQFFKKRRLIFVSVDAPASEHFMVMPSLDAVTTPRLAYLRAHGRNAPGYIRGRTVAERFDYDYSPKEIGELADRAEALSELASQTHVIFNNNKGSFAPKAASRFREVQKQRLAETLPGGE